MVITSTGTTLW